MAHTNIMVANIAIKIRPQKLIHIKNNISNYTITTKTMFLLFYIIHKSNMSNNDPDIIVIDLTKEVEIQMNIQIQDAEVDNLRRNREVEEENSRLEEAQRMIAEQDERRRQEELQLEADLRVAAAEEERIRNEATRRAILRDVAYAMRQMSVTNYLPPQTQVQCVTQDRYTLAEALTMGGDHRTPCRACTRNDPDECFWMVSSINLNLHGRELTGLENNQIRHRLYRKFIIDKYSYLREAEDNELMGHVGIPRIPLPTCVERDIRRFFPNEDGRPFVGFRRRGNQGRRNRNVPNI